MPFLGKPYFFEMHSPKKWTIPHRLLFWKIRGVIATSENTGRALKEIFPRLQEGVMIAPSGGIDTKKYERALPQQNVQRPAIVYTGSFQGWKGLDTAIEAARLRRDIHWYFAGDSADKLGTSLPENVHVIPWDPSPTASASWQKGADILILSGTNKDEYSSRFTSPTKIYEYMAAGRPIVAARTSAIEQAVSDTEVFFYEPDDAQSLRDTVENILTSPNEVKQKSDRAKRRACEYTWENRAKSIIDFMNKHARQ